MSKLPRTFYTRDDVVAISRELLGKYLVTNFENQLTAGIIVETEAYNGRNDRGCHAFQRRTKRTEVMYRVGGFSYVYLCYGIHHLFNITTNQEGFADAILIRAIEPIEGVSTMQERRRLEKIIPRLTSGPGCVSQALGISTSHYGEDLLGDMIWVEDRNHSIPKSKVVAGPRVGIDYAGEDAKLPWRFRIKDNKWVSKPN